jgi:hypothetical protein
MTTKMTIARAKFAAAGAGSPRGRLDRELYVRSSSRQSPALAYQAIKHKMEAINRREPNPPKTYVNHLYKAFDIWVSVVSPRSHKFFFLLFEQVARGCTEFIRAILPQTTLSLRRVKSLRGASRESTKELFGGQKVVVENGEVCEHNASSQLRSMYKRRNHAAANWPLTSIFPRLW